MKITEGVLGLICKQSTQRENKLPGILMIATSVYTTGRVTEIALFWSIASVSLSRWDPFSTIIHKVAVDLCKPAGSYHELLASKPREQKSRERKAMC